VPAADHDLNTEEPIAADSIPALGAETPAPEASEASAVAAKQRRTVIAWLSQHGIGVIGAVAAVAALVVAVNIANEQNRVARDLATSQDKLARDLADAGEVQENTRFVRQVDIENAFDKPFRRLNLRGATLSKLQLGCADTSTPDQQYGCADMFDADLIDADLSDTILTGAILQEADLTGADLTGADLDNVCSDSGTTWPAGSTPPPVRPESFCTAQG
jgi:hypothetical protein